MLGELEEDEEGRRKRGEPPFQGAMQGWIAEAVGTRECRKEHDYAPHPSLHIHTYIHHARRHTDTYKQFVSLRFLSTVHL